MTTTVWTRTSNGTRVAGPETRREAWSCLPFRPLATSPRLAAHRVRGLRRRAKEGSAA